MKIQLPEPITISMTCYGYTELMKNKSVVLTQISENEATVDLSNYKEIRLGSFKYKPNYKKNTIYLIAYRKYNDNLPKLDIGMEFKDFMEVKKIYL